MMDINPELYKVNRKEFYTYVQTKLFKKGKRYFKQVCPKCNRNNLRQKKCCSFCGENLEYTLF